jgi:NodT family efflux transporter outer membrane factor (OMF) lipoprotein
MRYLLVPAACALLAPVGCTSLPEWFHNGFKVGPNYSPPAVAVTHKWIDEGNPQVQVGNPNLACWWEIFDDPMLNKLIHESSTQNLTVRQAGILILQAQIQRNVAATELLPQGQDFVADYAHGVVSRNNGASPSAGAVGGTGFSPGVGVSGFPFTSTPINGATSSVTGAAGTTTTQTSPLISSGAGGGGGVPVGDSRFFNNWAGAANLSWELDFWGLFRRNLEAADAALDQQMQNRDEVMVQLLANVATQYIEIRTLQKRLELARQNVALQEPLVVKLKQQYEAGIANSKPAYFQLKSNLDATRAIIPPLETALRQSNNQLCVLLGLTVHDLMPELGDGMVHDPNDPSKSYVRIPRVRDETAVVGIPAETLLRRPDVVATERALRIQSAQIGIAEAELYPHIGINGTIGLAANRLDKVFQQQSLIGSIGPSLSWNILNYGRLLAQVRSQNNQYQLLVLQYQQSLLTANQDAENSLVAYLQQLEQTRNLKNSSEAATEVTKYYYTQLAEGYLPPAATSLSFYNQVFTAVNFQVQQQDAAAQAEGNNALDMILLYRSMGGGWQIRCNDGSCSTPAVVLSQQPVAAAQQPVTASAAPPTMLPAARTNPAPAALGVPIAVEAAPEFDRNR